jgi:hypothetical protein
MPFSWNPTPQIPTPPEPIVIPRGAVTAEVDVVANTVNVGGQLLYNTAAIGYDVIYPNAKSNVTVNAVNTFASINIGFANLTSANIGSMNVSYANITSANFISLNVTSANINTFYSPIIVTGTVSADPTTPLGIADKQYVDNLAVPQGVAANVGQISRYGGNTLPVSWFQANTQKISRTTYANLFSLIGTHYGIRDGVNTFTIPVANEPIENIYIDDNIQFPVNLFGHTLTKLSDNRWLVTGGGDGSTTAFSNTYIGTVSGNHITWIHTTPMPLALVNHQTTLLDDGRVIVTGGSSTAGVYSSSAFFGTISSNTIAWSAFATSMPVGKLGHSTAFVAAGTIIVSGGFNGSPLSDVVFGSISGTSIVWTSATSLPQTRQYHQSYILPNDGSLFVTPIFDNAGNNSIFGTISGTTVSWSNGTAPPYEPQKAGSAILTDGRIVLAGGTANGSATALANSLIATTTPSSLVVSWALAKAPPVYDGGTIINPAMGTLPDGRILMFGRTTSTGPTFPSPTWLGTVSGNNIDWFPQMRYFCTTTVISNNTIVLIGGYDGYGIRQNVFVGTVSTNSNHVTWSDANTIQLPAPRYVHTTIFLNDGGLLVLGGLGTAVASNTYFGTISGGNITWTEGSQLPGPRYGLTSLQLPDGRIVVMGGYSGSGATSNAWLGTISGTLITWVEGGNFPTPRYQFPSSLLNDGRILITGGFDAVNYHQEVHLGTVAGSTIQWASGTSLPLPREAHSQTTLWDGRILLVGGANPSLGTLNDTLIGTISANNNNILWEYDAPLPYLRQTHGSVLLSDGRVIITGGYDGIGTGSRGDSCFINFLTPAIKT